MYAQVLSPTPFLGVPSINEELLEYLAFYSILLWYFAMGSSAFVAAFCLFLGLASAASHPRASASMKGNSLVNTNHFVFYFLGSGHKEDSQAPHILKNC